MAGIKEIAKKLKKIKEMGYVKSKRKGATGIGYTLEELLGIKENNISSPDFGQIELKAQREKHAGLMTLFTFNNKAWKINQLEAIKKYGSLDKNDRMGLYYTIGLTPNSAGLFLYVDNDKVSVRHTSGEIVVEWELAEIERKFEEKVKSVLLVKAQVETRDGVEYFHYNRARLLSGGTSTSILSHLFKNEYLKIDLRLHDKGTPSARNHGTGFRVLENDLEQLYENIKEIEF